MKLKKMIEILEKQIGKHVAVYEAGRARRTVLASYATPEEVLAAFAAPCRVPYPERDAITLALVAEHQRAPHVLWQSLLLVAYAPLLLKMQVRGERALPDLEERTIAAFLDAAQRLPVHEPPLKVAQYLKNATDWEVFPRWRDHLPPPDEVPLDEDTTPSANRWEGRACETAEVRRILERETNKEELFEVLVFTVADEEPLFGYLTRTRPELSYAERWQAFRRLDRQRERVLRTLRNALGQGNLQRVLTNCTLSHQRTRAA